MCRLRLNSLGILLGMKAEHLRQCLIAATWDNTPDATNWLKVVSIVQSEFCDGTLVEESIL